MQRRSVDTMDEPDGVLLPDARSSSAEGSVKFSGNCLVSCQLLLRLILPSEQHAARRLRRVAPYRLTDCLSTATVSAGRVRSSAIGVDSSCASTHRRAE